MTPIKKGDFVTIADSDYPLTWEVTAIHEHASANGPLAALVSGQTGRRRYELVENLSLHTRLTEVA